MFDIHKHNMSKLLVFFVGFIFLINTQFQFSFMTPITFLIIIGLCLLNIYVPDSLVTDIIGVIIGIVIIYPIVSHMASFHQFVMPIIVDSFAGIVFIVYYCYKISKKSKREHLN